MNLKEGDFVRVKSGNCECWSIDVDGIGLMKDSKIHIWDTFKGEVNIVIPMKGEYICSKCLIPIEKDAALMILRLNKMSSYIREVTKKLISEF